MNGGANDSGQILKPDTLELMYGDHFSSDPRIPGQGLTFLLDTVGEHRIVWHDGGWPGFISSLLVVPESKLAVLAFTNTSAGALHGVADALLRELLDVAPLGSDLPRQGLADSPQLWPKLTGVYAPERGILTNLRHWGMFGGQLEVVVRDGHLTARSTFGPLRKGVRLSPVDADDPLRFEAVSTMDKKGLQWPLTLAFQRGPSGDVDAVAGRMLLPFRFVRRPAWRSTRWMTAGPAAAATAASALRRLFRSA
jgi:hypothetical protein